MVNTNQIKTKSLSGKKYILSNLTNKDLNKLVKLKIVIHLYSEYYFNKINKLIYKKIYVHNGEN